MTRQGFFFSPVMLGIEPESARARQVLYPFTTCTAILKFIYINCTLEKYATYAEQIFFLRGNFCSSFLTGGTTGRRKVALLRLLRSLWSSAEKAPILHAFR